MLGEALNYIGGSLDKPGRAVRGLLAGKPREALAAIPFSDTLGITDPGQRTSGRDLTDKIGITRSSDKGWGSWMLGTGAEMATDPLSYIPAGSVFKAFKGMTPGAKAAGQMASHVDDAAHAASRIAPAPVNVEAMRLNSAANNASRPRRFSVDPAKQQYYAADRQSRFANRFMGGGSDKLSDRLGDSSKALSKITPADYASMIKDEGNPLGRFKALADSAGVNMLPPSQSFSQDVESIFGRYGDRQPFALWSPRNKHVVPNTVGHPEMWSDGKVMQDRASAMRAGNWFSTSSPDHIGVHEIGHGLHPADTRKHWSDYPELFAGKSSPTHADAMGRIDDQVSQYGYSSPREFVAEAFAKRAEGMMPHWVHGDHLDPELSRIYAGLNGPIVPAPMLKKLMEYSNDASHSLAGTLGANPSGLSGGLADHGAAAGNASGGLSSRLRSLRENIPAIKDVGGPRERLVGGHVPLETRPELMDLAAQARGMSPDSDGLFLSPWWRDDIGPLAGSALINHPGAGREELLHGMIQNAAHTGDMTGLPLMGQLPARAYQLANKLGSRTGTGLAQVLDEMAAKTMSGRGAISKAANFADFWLNPETQAAYGQQFGKFGLAPRAFYHGMPFVPPVAAGAAARATLQNGDNNG